jgi:hypothetical protein
VIVIIGSKIVYKVIRKLLLAQVIVVRYNAELNSTRKSLIIARGRRGLRISTTQMDKLYLIPGRGGASCLVTWRGAHDRRCGDASPGATEMPYCTSFELFHALYSNPAADSSSPFRTIKLAKRDSSCYAQSFLFCLILIFGFTPHVSQTSYQVLLQSRRVLSRQQSNGKETSSLLRQRLIVRCACTRRVLGNGLWHY